MPESELALLYHYLAVGAAIFSIGLVGFLARRNMIVMFLSAEMMLQGVSINLVAFGRAHDDWGGQMLVLFIIAVAACEAAIGLILVLTLSRRSGNLDVVAWQQLREDHLPPYTDSEVPEVTEEQETWPRLTPAGIAPAWEDEELRHRDHV